MSGKTHPRVKKTVTFKSSSTHGETQPLYKIDTKGIELEDLLHKFKNLVENNDYLNDDAGSAFIRTFKVEFDNYITVDKLIPNFELSKVQHSDEREKYKKINEKYILFLAEILLYVEQLYSTQDITTINKLRNITTILTNIEETAQTGIYYMEKGLNSTCYNLPKVDIKEYLFTIRFIQKYNNDYFPKVKKLLNKIGIDCNDSNKTDCNKIGNSVIQEIIQNIQKKLTPEAKQSGGNIIKTMRKIRLLKRY
jgi:hypothetical protein